MQREEIEDELKEVEEQIEHLETRYFELTRDTGNIIKGFQKYIPHKMFKTQGNRCHRIAHRDRLFSLSSVTSRTSARLLRQDYDEPSNSVALEVVSNQPEVIQLQEESFKLEGEQGSSSSNVGKKTKHISKRNYRN